MSLPLRSYFCFEFLEYLVATLVASTPADTAKKNTLI